MFCALFSISSIWSGSVFLMVFINDDFTSGLCIGYFVIVSRLLNNFRVDDLRDLSFVISRLSFEFPMFERESIDSEVSDLKEDSSELLSIDLESWRCFLSFESFATMRYSL